MSEAPPKAKWGPGPWQDEPDAIDWRDEPTGLACAIRRNLEVTGSLCGYVGVPVGHALHGWRYDDDVPVLPDFEPDGKMGAFDVFVYVLSGARERGTIPLGMALKAHGGITWTGGMPDESDTAGRWWFGFDCGHAGDYMPGLEAIRKRMHVKNDTMRTFLKDQKFFGEGAMMPWGDPITYRTVDYATAECVSLASQLARLEKVVLAMPLVLVKEVKPQ